MKRWVLLWLTTIAVGCHGLPYSKLDVVESSIKLEGLYNAQEIMIVDKALRCLTPEIRRSISYIIFRSDQEHFEYYYCDQKRYAAAHAHDGTICFNRRYGIPMDVVWHESQHIYTFFLGTEFIKEWLEAAGKVYTDQYENYFWQYYFFGQNGVLRYYGLKNVYEDVAVWGEEIYNYCYGFTADSIFAKPQCIDHKDPRFLKKLNLLLKWKFITQEIYEKIKPLLS